MEYLTANTFCLLIIAISTRAKVIYIDIFNDSPSHILRRNASHLQRRKLHIKDWTIWSVINTSNLEFNDILSFSA